MIVNWTKNNIKTIPLHDEGRNVILAPGYNDVPNQDWKKARIHVLNQIEQGIIEEEWLKVKRDEALKMDFVLDSQMREVKDVASIPATHDVYIPAVLKDFNKTKATKIIFSTYHKDTLKKWLSVTDKDELRTALNYEMLWIDKPSEAQQLYGDDYGHGPNKE